MLQTAKIAKKCLENDFDLPTLFLNQISRPDMGLCFFKNGAIQYKDTTHHQLTVTFGKCKLKTVFISSLFRVIACKDNHVCLLPSSVHMQIWQSVEPTNLFHPQPHLYTQYICLSADPYIHLQYYTAEIYALLLFEKG